MTTRAYRPPLSGGTIWVGKHRPREMRRRDYIARRPVSFIRSGCIIPGEPTYGSPYKGIKV